MEFHPFDNQHLVMLGLLVVCICLLIGAAKCMTLPQRLWVGRLLGFLLLGYALAIYVQMGIAHELSWESALPLELCHCVLVACLVALFFPNQLVCEIAYFWGLGGTLQAVLTPEITRGFPSWEFIQFFWSHGTILLAIVFIISVQGFKPRAGSVTRMFLALNLYAAVVGTLDALFRWNYGYLCHKPIQPSLFDFLGPWPWYLVSLEFIALLSLLLLDLPWRWKRGKA
jgi:hypothetical integral membrane protein (TIGR02206 family)